MHPSKEILRLPELDPGVKAKIIRSGKKGFSGDRWAVTPTGTRDEGVAEQPHKRSQFALAELASPWPRIEDLKRLAHSEWTISSIKYRIAELKTEHRQQLAKALKYEEHENSQLVKDEYIAFDDQGGAWSSDMKEWIQSMHRMEHHLQMHQSDDFISSLRYSHILALKPLYEKLHQLLVIEEKARLQRARQFPKTSQGWREMDTRDSKLKVARFLMMDKKKQDDVILREADWRADRSDIDRVVMEYQTNIVFSEEVKNFVKKNQTTDPRRRG